MLIATHNIKVNGKWIAAGEAYEEAPAAKAPAEPVKEAPKAAEPAEAPKRPAVRRKK